AEVVTTGADGRVRRWDVTWAGMAVPEELLPDDAANSGGGTAVAVSERAVVVGYEDGYFAACAPDGERLSGGQAFDGRVASLAAAPDGVTFLAGGGRGKMLALDGGTDPWRVRATWSD